MIEKKRAALCLPARNLNTSCPNRKPTLPFRRVEGVKAIGAIGMASAAAPRVASRGLAKNVTVQQAAKREAPEAKLGSLRKWWAVAPEAWVAIA